MCHCPCEVDLPVDFESPTYLNGIQAATQEMVFEKTAEISGFVGVAWVVSEPLTDLFAGVGTVPVDAENIAGHHGIPVDRCGHGAQNRRVGPRGSI
jgi:hypothetical protein